MDLGPANAFTALEEGTPVYDPGRRRVGVVDQVRSEPPTHGIFEAVIIHTVPLPGRHRHGGEEALTREPSLERLARR